MCWNYWPFCLPGETFFQCLGGEKKNPGLWFAGRISTWADTMGRGWAKGGKEEGLERGDSLL